jgi:hypothetical protein
VPRQPERLAGVAREIRRGLVSPAREGAVTHGGAATWPREQLARTLANGPANRP